MGVRDQAAQRSILLRQASSNLIDARTRVKSETARVSGAGILPWQATTRIGRRAWRASRSRSQQAGALSSVNRG